MVDLSLKNIMSLLDTNETKHFSLRVDDILRFRKICVPKNDELKHILLFESHKSKLNLHLV